MRRNQALFQLLLFAAVTILSGTRTLAGPNLTPFTPPGWSGPVVVANNSNSTNESGDLLTTDTIYADWCVINSGNQDVNTSFDVNLYVDGALSQSWNVPNLPMNSYEYVTGYQIGSLSAGKHKVAVVADAAHVVPGDNESDNSYTNTFTVNPVILPAPTPETPANGSTGQPFVPFFSWSSVSKATSYRVLVATDAGSLPTDPLATNGGAGIVLDAVAPTTNFSPTITLSASTTYYWEVHGNPGSDDGTWTGIQQFTTGPTPNGLTIIPTFDSTITSDPQAATIEATIKAAISVYRNDFSDAVTANFTFVEMSGGLGLNNAEEIDVNYSDYLTALASQATTADDATALAFLPSSGNNPVNGNSQVTVKLPLARALGFDAPPPAGQPDATVYLNTSIMNLSSTVTDPNKFSLFSTVSHEMNEALGFGSALNGLVNGDPEPTGPVFPEDLFRYDGSGDRSLTTDLNATSFFSLDGTTDLAEFNQNDNGDFGDWYSGAGTTVIPQVQDAFLLNGANPVLGVELRGLDVIGFTRVIPSSAGLPAAAQLTNAVVSGGNFVFSASGTVGDKYVIQISTNLVNWAALLTNTIPANGVILVTNAIGGRRELFYRVVSNGN